MQKIRATSCRKPLELVLCIAAASCSATEGAPDESSDVGPDAQVLDSADGNVEAGDYLNQYVAPVDETQRLTFSTTGPGASIWLFSVDVARLEAAQRDAVNSLQLVQPHTEPCTDSIESDVRALAVTDKTSLVSEQYYSQEATDCRQGSTELDAEDYAALRDSFGCALVHTGEDFEAPPPSRLCEYPIPFRQDEVGSQITLSVETAGEYVIESLWCDSYAIEIGIVDAEGEVIVEQPPAGEPEQDCERSVTVALEAGDYVVSFQGGLMVERPERRSLYRFFAKP